MNPLLSVLALVTIELRYFFEVARHPVPTWPLGFFAGSPETPRCDYYAPCGPEAGLKIRGPKLELKLLEAEFGAQPFGAASGNPERWAKYGFSLQQAVPSSDWVEVSKRRWIEVFSLAAGAPMRVPNPGPSNWPQSGAQVELCFLQVPGLNEIEYWTFAIEVFGCGASLAQLHTVVSAVFPGGLPAFMDEPHSMSYPAWLASLARPCC